MKNKIEDRDKAVEIYLTEDELQALYEMPLTGKNDHIRDVFLIGCYTCQRVSDYNPLDYTHVGRTRQRTRGCVQLHSLSFVVGGDRAG